MSKVLDKKYIDDHYKGETWLVMTYLLEQKGVPVTTNKIADDTGASRYNVASRLCAMRVAGAITSTINPDYRPGSRLQRNLWAINPTIPTRYRKRTKAKAKAKVKAKVKVKLENPNGYTKRRNIFDWEPTSVASSSTSFADELTQMRAMGEQRVVEIPIKPNPTKGKIGVLLELIDAWKVPYAEAVEILHILTKREE